MPNILFIDDDADRMLGLIECLESEHSVTKIKTGAEAIHELRNNSDKYDLVILDLMLAPGMATVAEDEIPEMPRDKIGEYIFQQMGDFCPSKPTILITAFRSNMNGLRVSISSKLLQKPVLPARILREINVLLGEAI